MGFFKKNKPVNEPDQMLTAHFSLREAACQCGCGMLPDIESVRRIETLRDRFGRPMKVLSWARCKRHNQSVGGAPESYHVLGRAIDIETPDAAYRYKLIAAAIASGFNGIGVYSWGVHIDDRPVPTMWVG